MRILIDECLDWRLCRALAEHHCVSVHQMKWNGLTNGMLLEKAQHEFDVFLTRRHEPQFSTEPYKLQNSSYSFRSAEHPSN